MTDASKPFEPRTPWPEYKGAREPAVQSIGRFAMYAMIRAHGIPWVAADAVYFEIGDKPAPANAADMGRILEAAYTRALERAANGVRHA